MTVLTQQQLEPMHSQSAGKYNPGEERLDVDVWLALYLIV